MNKQDIKINQGNTRRRARPSREQSLYVWCQRWPEFGPAVWGPLSGGCHWEIDCFLWTHRQFWTPPPPTHTHTHTIVRLSFASLFHILAGQWPSFRLCKSGIYWAFRAKTCHGPDLQIYPNANMNLHSQQISTQNLRNAWMKWCIWEIIFLLPVVLPHLFCYERRNTVNSGFLKICLGILCPSAPPDCPAPGAQFSL